MTVHEIAVPAEPISAVIRGQLEARRAAARKQWEFATAAWHAAKQAMIKERRIYDMLDCLLQAGPGHVAADFRNSPLSITGIPQGTSGAEGLG
jgi:hypothetical protein